MVEKQKCISLRRLILICLIGIAILSILLLVFAGDKSWLPAVAYLIAAAAIATGGCIAYHNLRIIQGTERAAVLTNLDICWTGPVLEDSRVKFLRLKNRVEKIEDENERGRLVKELLLSYKKNRLKEYRALIGMVNFFETIGYFSRVGYILPDDAIELYGPAIRNNDKMFRSHILELQEETNDKSIYNNFIWLADKAK